MEGGNGGKGLKRAGFEDALFATVGLGLFFLIYLRTTVTEKAIAIAVLLAMLGLTYLVVKGLVVFAKTEEKMRSGNCPPTPLLILLFLFYVSLGLYDVPASLGYISFFATSALELVGLDYVWSIIATAIVTIAIVAIMYYSKRFTAKMRSLKMVYTSILMVSVPVIGLGDGPAVSITGLLGLIMFSLVGFSPILTGLIDKGYHHNTDSLREYVTGTMLGFTVTTLAEAVYLVLGLSVFDLQLMPLLGRVLVSVNGLLAYVGFAYSFAMLVNNLKRVFKALKTRFGSRVTLAFAIPLKATTVKEVQDRAFGLVEETRNNEEEGNDKFRSLLLAIFIETVVGTLLLILHYPVETYLEFSGMIGGIAQYSTTILAFVWSKRGKEKAEHASQVTYNTF